ncbi:hypothetical protein MPLSOD_410019 [Mesorhizobium sp. SOD10]|nr:hypothetical protein MPLSOD_410019 [Mesorhizobium sp. SOD10]
MSSRAIIASLRRSRMITDKLRSYGAARRQVMPGVEHRSHKRLNNQAENAHVPLRKRERMMQDFRSPGALQRFVSIFSALRNLFVAPRSKRAPLSLHTFTACTPWPKERCGRGQLKSAAAGLNAFICRQRDIALTTIFLVLTQAGMRQCGSTRNVGTVVDRNVSFQKEIHRENPSRHGTDPTLPQLLIPVGGTIDPALTRFGTDVPSEHRRNYRLANLCAPDFGALRPRLA